MYFAFTFKPPLSPLMQWYMYSVHVDCGVSASKVRKEVGSIATLGILRSYHWTGFLALWSTIVNQLGTLVGFEPKMHPHW